MVFLVRGAMLAPNSKIPWLSNRAAAIERFSHLLLALIIAGVIYRYCWIDIADPFKCSALLNQGTWLDPGPIWSPRNPFQNWQPPGCMMHEYKKEEIEECFRNQRLVFIGDSTTRQIFWAVAKKMEQDRAEEGITEMLDLGQKHKDLEFTSGGVTVQFLWDPWLNSTQLDHELRKFSADPSSTGADSGGDESAALILLGAPGLWYARHGQENYFKDFRDSIDAVIPYMDHKKDKTAMLPKPRPFPLRKRSPNFLLLAPVQVPWYQALSPSREETITPEKIDQMNDYLQQTSAHSRADVVWSYSLMTWAGRGEYEESGLHVVDNVAHRKADILLNLRCNADSAAKGYPFNRTCCSNYVRPVRIQWVILLTGMLALPGLSFVRRKHVRKIGRFLPSAEILSAMVALGLIVCFCFYADRTQIFEKAHKQYRRREFRMACLATAAAGLASIKRSKVPITKHKTAILSKDIGFLSRDQTDEWKGWMQFFILIYHYTRASKTLWIYEIVRLLVASYLFMTGFGHALYFLRKEDYTLKRVAGVLIRLNFLSCLLPYMMQTDYLFYYFAPLVSFWYLVVYFTLRIGRRGNSDINFLFAKILLSAMITTAFTMIPGILEFVSFFLKYTCGISWNMTEWRFRTFLDLYIVYVGMIMAVFYHQMSQLKSGSITPRWAMDKLLYFTIIHPYLFKTISVIGSLVLLPGFWMLTRRSPDKEDYNWWQPYVSFIPILSFVTLRNSHRCLRNYHSAVFAWLGRCSLETYVLQYHIWLAGDTSGLLRLGLWGRWTEAAILTSIFLWVSWCAADATQKITSWVVNGNAPATAFRDVHEDVAAPKNSPYILPKLQERETTPKEVRIGIGRGRVATWLVKCVVGLRKDLRWRLGLMLLAMWVGNVTYR